MIERKAVTMSRLKHELSDELQRRRDRLFDGKMTEVRRMKDELRRLEEESEKTEREARKNGLIRE